MRLIRTIFGRMFPSPPSLKDRIEQVFPTKDQELAEAFYKPWINERHLPVRLGDGSDLQSREKFFARAWFVFIWPPIDESGWTIIGTHAEDELGVIIVGKYAGHICYRYDNASVELADSFPEFIQSLRAAGWNDG